MPQLDPAVFAPQLIWLAISFAVLYFLMAKVALPRIGNALDARQEKIDDNLTAAEELRGSAQADEAAYEQSLTRAREQARGQIQEAVRAVSQDAAQRQEALGQRLAQTIKSAETEIERAKANARASIREAAVGVTQAATERLIGVTPSAQQVGAAVDQALQARSSRGGA